MIAKQLVEKDSNGRILCYGSKVMHVSHREEAIILRGLKLYLDFNPRKVKDRPSYEEKCLAVHMIETLKHSHEVSIQEAEEG